MPKLDSNDGKGDARAGAPDGAADSSLRSSQPLEETSDFTPLPTPAAAPAAPDVPAAFGRYQVRQPLGSGGFGAVFLGHDSELDRPVAIKVLRGGANVSAQETERFLEEARRAARLRHPGIVTVHDVGVQHGQVYIVADYLDGVSLRDWLVKNRPTWQDAARIAAHVADALAHAHARLTIHRDVKPANIQITSDDRPVLVDFGLGIDDAAGTSRELGIISGTPAYMSPEQIAGAGHRIDGRTDIYSLGVVLYEMLCGQLPFRATDQWELLRQVTDDLPQPPRQLKRSIPAELERICLKAMAKRIQDRHTTAGDLAEELHRVVQHAASIAAPPASVTSSAPSGGLAQAPPASSSSSSSTPSSKRRAQGAERRQVTVLFCGCALLESEEFLQQVDPEDQARLLRAVQQAGAQAVRRFDGALVHSNDEGLLACFGFPVAYEDAAGRAVRSALALLEDLHAIGQQLRRRHRLELAPWIGLHTSSAVVEQGEDSISVIGEARNAPARLRDFAGPGQIVCSDSTRRLIHNYFDCESLGSHKVKGLPRPLELYRLVGLSQTGSPLDAATRLTPLTGRDNEVRLLKERWEQANEGMGQIVLILGEPGLGKSRLVHTLKLHVQQGAAGETAAEGGADATIVEWRCSPHYQNTGLYPVSDFFDRLLGLSRLATAEAKVDRLVLHLEELGMARPDVVPLFVALLSLPPDDRFPALTLTAVRQKEETFRALEEWLRALSSRRPVLFIVEDLHWIDASTLEYLGQFVAAGLHDRVLTLLTFRPEFKTPWPAVAHQTSLALTRLTRRQVGEIIAKKTGLATPPAALVEQVHDRTGGVPLFVEEFTRMIQEAGALDQVGPDSTRLLSSHEIPTTLQDLVMARLDHMASNREVAQLAATLGREFSHELLAAVSDLDAATLEAELAKLVGAELLFQKGRPPACTYVFKHALLEDAAYNSLLKEKRRQFHQRIAAALETRFAHIAETQPELVAHHATEAGLTEKGMAFWLKAGLRSVERSAHVEAISHLTRGLALVDALEASPERDALELQFQSPLGTAYLTTRGYAAPEVGPVFQRARELCERVGQPPQLFAVMWGAWAWHVVRGDFRLCMDLAAEAMALAQRLGDPGITMEAMFTPGLTMLYRGDFTGAREHCGRAVAEFEDRERTRFWSNHTGQNSGVTHRCYLALALWHLGYPDQALQVGRELVALARAIAHPFSLGYGLHHTAWLYQHCRLGRETQAAGAEEQKVAQERGFTMWYATGVLYEAAGWLLEGKVSRALPVLQKGLDFYRSTGAALALPFYLSILGDAYAKSGQHAEALQSFEEGLALAEQNDDLFQTAELLRQKGELLLAQSPDNAVHAEECFTQSLAVARRQNSKAWELRTTMSLARLWQAQGRSERAHAALETIFGAFTEGFATPDLLEAKALLAELGRNAG